MDEDTQTFTKDTALSENGRVAAGEQHGNGMVYVNPPQVRHTHIPLPLHIFKFNIDIDQKSAMKLSSWLPFSSMNLDPTRVGI
jgi:hypothetical protein